MPSPFPGMAPWLESPRCFGDLHDSLIYGLQETLQPLLPPTYFASKGVRVWLETMVVEVTERYLDIYNMTEDERRLVASIEILSPSNKSPSDDGRPLYLKKQREMLLSGVHLIEIDLLRSGRHTTAVPRDLAVEKAGPFDYHVSLHCFNEPNLYYVYPIRLQDRLPEIAVPLLPGDPVVTLDLQAVFNRAYDAGPFGREIDYLNETPEPPLNQDQHDWALQLVRPVDRAT
jgi:hypothetical protein